MVFQLAAVKIGGANGSVYKSAVQQAAGVAHVRHVVQGNAVNAVAIRYYLVIQAGGVFLRPYVVGVQVLLYLYVLAAKATIRFREGRILPLGTGGGKAQDNNAV